MNHTELSRTQTPPGGWQFHQPQTGWSAPMPIANTFDQQVRHIIAMRQKNPAVAVKHNLSTDPAQVGKELELFTRRRLGLPVPLPPPPSSLVPGMGALAGAGVSEIKRLATGAALLMEWNAGGQPPVDAQTALSRASICSTCPRNDPAKYEQWLAIPMASTIKARIARLNSLKLRTDLDSKLGVCSGLFCPNLLFVHAPKDLVAKRAKDPSAMDPKCWVLAP